VSAVALLSAVCAAAQGAPSLQIGVPQLWHLDPALTGAGVTVGQSEATTYTGSSGAYDPAFDADNYQIDPNTNTGIPITYRGKLGTATTLTYSAPNPANGHPTQVAANFFGSTNGVAPGLTAVVNFNENYFFSEILDRNAAITSPLAPNGAPPVSVVNQSFVFLDANANDTQFICQLYDNYVQEHGTIFVSGAGNGGAVQVPSTAFNVISVGAYGGASSVGPTSGVSASFDGRSKPDITAPEGATSFSTALVSGVAAILVQSGNLGRGGSAPATIAAATDARTIKALLLNGATKPAGWTHSSTQPLDFRYGAGIVNAYNSYQNLVAGMKAPTTVNLSQTPTLSGNVGTAGWNFSTLTSTAGSDGVAHYHLDLSAANGPTMLTSTLVWWRPEGTVETNASGYISQVNLTTINNLDMMLYNSNGTLVDSSASPVDNVEHLYTLNLAPGQYDLEVVKKAGGVTPSETYSMAFNLSGGAINLVVNGTYDMNGVSQTVGGITGTGQIINSLNSTLATLTVVGSSQFDGTIGGSVGGVALQKSVGGVLKLTGSNVYTGGTIVDGGTLLVSNTTGSGTGSGAVTLNGGALGGYGTISGAVLAGTALHTIAPSATLASNSTGKLTVGALTTNSNTRLAFNLVTPGTSSVNDMIAVSTSGGLTLNGGTIQITGTSTGAGSLGFYRLIQYSGAIGGTGAGSLILPSGSNGIAYVLDLAHTPGFIDIHRGFLGDANDDGTVNFSDFVALSNHYGISNQGWSGGDFDANGITNFADFVVLSNHYGQSVGSNLVADASPEEMAAMQAWSAGTGVPEPTTLGVLGLGLLGLLGLRRRRVS
jgi:autotransporter-associated beta strand protein